MAMRIWSTGKDDKGNDTSTVQYSDKTLKTIVSKNDSKDSKKG